MKLSNINQSVKAVVSAPFLRREGWGMGLILSLFLASALTASAQLPARRTMKQTTQTEAAAKEGQTPAKGRSPLGNRLGDGPKSSNVTPPPAKAAANDETAKAAATGAKAAATGAKPAGNAAPKPAGNGGRPAGASGRPGAAAAPPANGVSYREFPTAATMPDDAAWRRDIYRSIDLTKEKNAALYFPVTPVNGRQNLFVFLFRQILRGNIKAYEYTLDANEHFDAEHQLRGKKIMDTHNIYYETVDGKMRVNDADLPSEDVKLYFVKESVYYDQRTASFRTKVTALCPVMVSGTNDFGEDEMQRVPLFWVNYEEAAPYLAKLSLMGSSMNNAAVVSADDYFTMNRYEGDIYKTTNLQDRIIAQYAESPEEQLAERKRIEGELGHFEDYVWGHEPERLLDAYGNPVLDGDGKAITYNANHELVDSRGRRIAFAVAGKDSTNVASDTPDIDPLPTIVLLNERGFAVDEDGQPLLTADGSPVSVTDEYPDPVGLDDGKKKAPAKSSSATASRRSTTSTPARRPASSTSSKSSGNKSSASSTKSSAKSASKSSAPKTKAPKASAPKASSSKGGNGTLSVRKERH